MFLTRRHTGAFYIQTGQWRHWEAKKVKTRGMTPRAAGPDGLQVLSSNPYEALYKGLHRACKPTLDGSGV